MVTYYHKLTNWSICGCNISVNYVNVVQYSYKLPEQNKYNLTLIISLDNSASYILDNLNRLDNQKNRVSYF